MSDIFVVITNKAGINLFLVSILFSSVFSEPSDIVRTKDQRVYEGVITEEDTASVFIKLEEGSIVRISQSNVLSIGRYLTDPYDGYHLHDGFFFSMNIGGGRGYLNWERSNKNGTGTASLSGAGPMNEFKIGGAVKKNLILSFELVVPFPIQSGDFSGKGMGVNGLGVANSPDTASVTFFAGVGLGGTYYFMPHNVFLSGTLGVGAVSVDDKYGLRNNYDYGDSTRFSEAVGYFIQFKVGKEWWVSKNWGLGISAAYSFFRGNESAAVGDQGPLYTIDPSYKGSFSANQFGILFNTTFN